MEVSEKIRVREEFIIWHKKATLFKQQKSIHIPFCLKSLVEMLFIRDFQLIARFCFLLTLAFILALAMFCAVCKQFPIILLMELVVAGRRC